MSGPVPVVFVVDDEEPVGDSIAVLLRSVGLPSRVYLDPRRFLGSGDLASVNLDLLEEGYKVRFGLLLDQLGVLDDFAGENSSHADHLQERRTATMDRHIAAGPLGKQGHTAQNLLHGALRLARVLAGQ